MEAITVFNVKGNLKEIEKHLWRSEKRQIPFSAAKAINDTLFQIMKAEKVQMSKKLDRPTPYTLKGFKVSKANKRRLSGSVEITPSRWKYLKYQVEGGARTGRIGVPTINAKLNKYGNISGKRKGLIKGKKQFMTDKGVWQKTGGKKSPKTKLIVSFNNQVTYRKRFPFYKIADGVARSRFQQNFVKSMNYALRTAR